MNRGEFFFSFDSIRFAFCTLNAFLLHLFILLLYHTSNYFHPAYLFFFSSLGCFLFFVVAYSSIIHRFFFCNITHPFRIRMPPNQSKFTFLPHQILFSLYICIYIYISKLPPSNQSNGLFFSILAGLLTITSTK